MRSVPHQTFRGQARSYSQWFLYTPRIWFLQAIGRLLALSLLGPTRRHAQSPTGRETRERGVKFLNCLLCVPEITSRKPTFQIHTEDSAA